MLQHQSDHLGSTGADSGLSYSLSMSCELCIVLFQSFYKPKVTPFMYTDISATVVFCLIFGLKKMVLPFLKPFFPSFCSTEHDVLQMIRGVLLEYPVLNKTCSHAVLLCSRLEGQKYRYTSVSKTLLSEAAQ